MNITENRKEFTSAEVAKLLRNINDQLQETMELETASATYNAAVSENPESVRPDYDYAETQEKIALLEAQVRKIKHILNLFNSSQTVPGFDMTIDQMLIYIPQLSEKRRKLEAMQRRLPKQRVQNRYPGCNIIDYEYANYDIGEVKKEYAAVSDELARAQTALDLVNSTVKFELTV